MRFRVAALHEWHRWFAWHPVYTEDTQGWIWLETVARRLVGGEVWEYEDIR